MTGSELLDHCRNQQQVQNKPNATVVLEVPGRWGKRDTKRLFPGGPMCRIVGEARGRVQLMCTADTIISALERLP